MHCRILAVMEGHEALQTNGDDARSDDGDISRWAQLRALFPTFLNLYLQNSPMNQTSWFESCI